MRKLAQALALLSLAVSGWSLFQPKRTLGAMAAIVLSPLKLVAGSLTAFAAAVGVLAAVLGLLFRAPLALVAGGIGAVLSARYVRRTTAAQDGFEQAFGPDWQRRVALKTPAERAARMLRRRWTWFVPSAPAPCQERDLPFWTLPSPRAGNVSGEGGRRLLCDLWQPPRGTAPSGLALLFFHGGGWHQFDKDSYGLTRPLFRHLAAQGHVVMDVAYRLYPEADMVDMLADSKRAVAWMKATAGRYGVDAERVVVAGGSAGGHLALLAAYTPGHPELTPAELEDVDTSVRAAVAFYPPLDLQAYVAYNDYPSQQLGPLDVTSPGSVVRGALGGTPEKVPERYELIAPISHVDAGCPPTLLVRAGHDHVVPPGPIRALRRRLEEAGVPVVCLEFPAAEHVFDLVLPWISPAAQAAWYDLDRFLALML